MLVKTIVCLTLIILCLGVSFFPKKFWDLSFRIPLAGKFYQEQIKQWPSWALPIWLWLIRIAGIFGVIIGIWLLFDKR